MNYLQLNDQVSVSGQLELSDVSELLDKQVELLVCNRPDGEDEGQTPFDDIKAIAEEKGMEFRMLPFSSYQIDPEDRDKLVAILCEKKRTHLYCRSGARSKRLWRMANKIGCGGHDFKSI